MTKLENMSNIQTSSEINEVLLSRYCTTFNDKMEFIQSNFKSLSSYHPSVLLETISLIMKEFEIEDNITAMVLSTNLHKLI